MALWKDTNGNIHDDMDGQALLLPSFPSGLTQLTDEEVTELLTPKVIELTYQQKRAAEYPPFTDYLDAIVKDDKEQLQAYIDECNAVKEKYPKC